MNIAGFEASRHVEAQRRIGQPYGLGTRKIRHCLIA